MVSLKLQESIIVFTLGRLGCEFFETVLNDVCFRSFNENIKH